MAHRGCANNRSVRRNRRTGLRKAAALPLHVKCCPSFAGSPAKLRAGAERPEMIQVDCCVVCGGVLARQRRGVVTPFLAQRIGQHKRVSVSLAECSACGFQFFNPRLEPAEEASLYGGYRSPEYQKMRQSFEPWYTEKLNASIAAPEAWKYRIGLLHQLFHGRLGLDGRSFGNVLDFGGDRGELIAELVPASRRFVYEISGVPPVAGVEALHSIEECRRYRFDLIVTSNVLEHIGSPRELIAQLASIAAPETLVFNEVPYESVSDWSTRFKRLAQAGVLAMTRPAIAARVLGPGMFNLMHEHVNYFSPHSLNRLMEVSGFGVLDSGDYLLTPGLFGARMAWNLTQKRSGQ